MRFGLGVLNCHEGLTYPADSADTGEVGDLSGAKVLTRVRRVAG